MNCEEKRGMGETVPGRGQRQYDTKGKMSECTEGSEE